MFAMRSSPARTDAPSLDRKSRSCLPPALPTDPQRDPPMGANGIRANIARDLGARDGTLK